MIISGESQVSNSKVAQDIKTGKTMFQVRDTGVGKSQTPKQSPKPSRQQPRIQHAFCSLDKFCIIRKHTWVLVSFNYLTDIWNTECKHLHSLI